MDTKEYNKFVSVVVPAFNAKNTISKCIESLLNLDYPKDKLEIIIVNNNSTDETPDIIKSYPVTYLLEKKRGPAAARNVGAKFAKGEFVAFTDSDCLVDKNWLKYLINGLDDRNVAGCGGEAVPYKVENSLDRYCAKMFWPIKKIIGGELYGFPYIITANAIYRKAILEEVGYFDESFPVAAHEDTDLGWRISRKDYKLIYIPDAKIIHCHRTTLMGLYEVGFKGGYGAAILYNKHKNFQEKRPLNISTKVWELIICFLKFFKKTNPEDEKVFDCYHILFQCAYLTGFINSKISRLLNRKDYSQKDKKISWQEILKHLLVASFVFMRDLFASILKPIYELTKIAVKTFIIIISSFFIGIPVGILMLIIFVYYKIHMFVGNYRRKARNKFC